MGQEKGTKWTPQQVEIFKLVTAKKSTVDIAKLLGCSHPTITKVKNAMKKGETPADKKPPVEETISATKKPHVIPKTSNPIDVKQTVTQYKNSTGNASGSEAEQPPAEDQEQEPGEETPEGTETGNRKPGNQ